MSELTPAQQQWVDALRSGEFKQAPERLRTDDGRYCCLGVACEVAMRAGVLDRTLFRGDDLDLARYPQVKTWLEITSDDGNFEDGTYVQSNLTALNDGTVKRKHTFAEIAGVIERRPKGLFRDDKGGAE